MTRGRGWRPRLAIVLFGVAGSGLVADIVSQAGRASARPGEPLGQILAIYLAFLAYATVGLLILIRRPENRIGWLVGAIGFFPLASGLSETYVRLGADWPLADVARWYGDWYFIAATGSLPLLFLLFPDGRPAARRWRWAVLVAGMGLAAELLRYMIGPSDDAREPNPYQLAAARPILGVLDAVGAVGLLLGLLAGVASLGWRYHRARDVERQQVKWFAAAVGFDLLLVAVIAGATLVWPRAYWVANNGLVVILVLPTAALVAAVLRYRLYDIDRLVSRTIAYATLTLLIAVPYVLVVTWASRVVGTSNDLVIALTTLAAAAAVNPLRRRIQRRVDRRFNRARYDAARIAEEFSARLRQDVDLDSVRSELITVVRQTVQPASASLWLRR